MSKLKLSDREWRGFKVGELFEVINCSPEHKVNLLSGTFPYITRTAQNNGLEITIQKTKNINPAKVVTFGAESVKFFYQPFDFIAGNKMYYLTLKTNQKINKFVGLFITHFCQSSLIGTGYGYGMGLTGSRFKSRKILLPITPQNTPDWQFMEDFSKQKYEEVLTRIPIALGGKSSENTPAGGGVDVKDFAHHITDHRTLDEVEWGEFRVSDVFENMSPGKSKGMNHLSNGKTPYLGATNRSNGVLDFVEGSANMIQKGNCIAFIRNGEGSMGYSVYKCEDFIATSDITVGYIKELNRFSGMFITTIADRVRGKYTFNYKRSDTRLKKETLTLPITPNNTPDWQFMEQFMKCMENNVIRKAVQTR